MSKQYEIRQVSPKRWIWELRGSDGILKAMTCEIFRTVDLTIKSIQEIKGTAQAKRIINMDSDYQVKKREGEANKKSK